MGKENIVIFLGAGASASEGAPTQNQLFKRYFSLIHNSESPLLNSMDEELRLFFLKIFNIDITLKNQSTQQFPTFEEVLGILDIAEEKNESFSEYNLENNTASSGRLRRVKQAIIFSMAKVISAALKSEKGYHKSLVENLKKKKLIGSVTFITTNYDILIDNAITNIYPDVSLDYCVELANYENEHDWQRPNGKSIKLLKLHGSLNWLYCNSCNSLTLTPKEKGVIRLIDNMTDKDVKCKCGNIHIPIIVPPSYFKNMNNIFLANIWNKSLEVLRKASVIIFCGYSFPDADLHIKYLIKKALLLNKNSPRIVIANSYKGKSTTIEKEEKLRYSRFLNIQHHFTGYGFESFSKYPTELINYGNKCS